MQARVSFSLLAASIAAVVLVSASGAATRNAPKIARIDVSTRAAVVDYLRSMHVDSRGAVIERGARNYAGAHCPGKAWSCASTRHTVVQIARHGGQNRFACASKRCVVVQLAGASGGVYVAGRSLATTTAAATNTAKCIRISGLTQSCTIDQESSTANNVAIVVEAAASSALTQTASYTTQITQHATGASNSNTACVSQNVLLDGSTKSGSAVSVALEAHQSIAITQDSAYGGNTVENATLWGYGSCDATHPLTQTQSLTSGVSSPGSVTQSENSADAGPNVSLDIEQNQDASFIGTAHGPNTAAFDQVSNVLAVASTPAGPVSQTQSSPSGGIEATINQDSRDVSTASAKQTERQCEDAVSSGSPSCSAVDPPGYSLTQTQYGPVRKGAGVSAQTGNSADTFSIDQSSTQNDDSGSGQTNLVEADCVTSGNCTASQTTNVQGQTTTNTQSGQSVNTVTACTGSTCTTGPPTPTITGNPVNPSSSSSAPFSFSDSDSTASFECQIDNSGYSACTPPWVYDNLADGTHTFSVKAKDASGESAPATFTWTIAGGGANATTVQQLNPTTDPTDPSGTCADWIASGTGFDGTPTAVSDTQDLSAYDGQAIELRFSFDTGDALYNDFEGWFINNIKVTGTQSGNPVTVFTDPVADGDSSFTASSTFGATPGWHVSDRLSSTFGTAWWYGNEATGTYQSPNPIDSCTDSSPSAGTITTPVFTLPMNSQLSFDTLWQIEGVNPSTYDLMDVQVIPVTSASGQVIG